MISGNLRKMTADLKTPVEYSLILNDQKILLNSLLGQPVQLRFTGKIFCIQCSRKTTKSFQQGYCYPCMQRLAECNFCIIHPEKCGIGQGHCPENDWAHAQCSQTHIVYLANSSGLKVGITREKQASTRWIDQGAIQALPICQVANRYQSGLIEVCLKQFVNDRTDWRKLLKAEASTLDLSKERNILLEKAKTQLQTVVTQFPSTDIQWLNNSQELTLKYPVEKYPVKINNFSFDKNPMVTGLLQGIKGQYLLLDNGVINIRKFAGYHIELKS